MARKSSQSFVAPRGEDGKFIPRSKWPKKTRKEFDKLREQGAFKGVKKNPIVKSVKGRRRGKNVWIPPHDKAGRFLPMAQWSAADKKAYRRALKDGLVPGSLVPRGHTGRFASDGSSGSRGSRKGRSDRPQDESYDSDDLYNIRRGVRRLEHRFDDLLDEIDRAARNRREAPVALPAHECADGSCSPRRAWVTQIPEDREYEDYDDPTDAEYSEGPCDMDPCQSQILSEVRQLTASCDSAIERAREIRPNRSLARYDRDRSLMYNRPRMLGQRFHDILGYLKEHPVIAIIGVGALALVGFALYKTIRTIMSNMVAGAAIRQGVMSFPGSEPYMITQDDALWLIRAIWGEVNRSNSRWETQDVQRGSAAVLWALANNYMTVGQKRSIYPTFGQFIQAYCQPINPIWASAGASGCQRNPGACSSDTLAFRQALRSKPWAQFPAGAQALVTAFVNGTLANPIGRRTDWAAAGAGRTTIDSVNVAGNVFLTDPSARSRTASA
jgi:hypothetical protein